MLEGYITPLLMSYIDKYVKNIKPSDLKLSFWGGDAVLRNLELRLDVLERELGIPVEFKSGCIRELTLHLPWNAIGSSPVQVTIKDLEFVVKLKSLRANSSSSLATEETLQQEGSKDAESAPSPSVATGDKEPAPSYLQGYLNRIVNNVYIQVQNMVVKVILEESDLMLTFNIGSGEFYSANEMFQSEFVYTDYFQDEYCINKVIEVKDMTVNLHPIEMREKAQGGLLHEPFVSRCGFVCRMKFDYQGKVVERRTWELVVNTLEISVDEKQFCLSLHLADWLLGMYYSTKRLKGRDENPFLEMKDKPLSQSGSSEMHATDSTGSAEYDDDVQNPRKTSSGSGNVTDSRSEGPYRSGSVGWGTWLLSFAGPESDTESSTDGLEDGSKAKEPIRTKSSLILSAESVTVLLNMTQLVQVPVFTRSFTSPVVRVAFSRCMFRLDRCPVTKLFWMCVGIGAVKADVMGVCPCVKKFPASWRRTLATDAGQVSQVFSLGPVEPIEESATMTPVESDVDTGRPLEIIESDVDLVAPSGSNSAEELIVQTEEGIQTEGGTSPTTSTILPTQTHSKFCSEMGTDSLASMSEPFKAVWFTYDYHDVGPVCSVEECTEVLNVGRIGAVFSPDVVHRLELFKLAFQESMKVTPSVSIDSVVLGDPSANVHFQIYVSQLSMALTTSSHYLSTVPTLLPTSQSLHYPSAKRGNIIMDLEHHLPCLRVSFAGLEADMILPMYRKNALPSLSQKQDIRVCVHNLQAATSPVEDLDVCMKLLSQQEGVQKGDFIKLPLVDFSYHSVEHCDVGGDSEGESEQDTSHMKLELAQATATLSNQHLWDLLYVYKSWTIDESLFSTPHSEYMPLLGPRCPSHISFTLSGLMLSKATNYWFISYSVVLGALRGAVRRKAESGTARFSPFLYGPFDSSKWNSVELYQTPGGTSDEPFTRNLMELLVTTPRGNFNEEAFSTAQLTMAGCAVHMEPAILDFLRHLPPQTPLSQKTPSPPSPTMEPAPLPYTLTPTVSVVDEPSLEPELVEDGENRILKQATSYAIRVKSDPILLISSALESLPTNCPGISSNLFDNFPVLSQIRPHATPKSLGLPSSKSLPPGFSGIIVSLPGILLESAKSHVLDEPVPRLSRTNTLPWDCTLSEFSTFTISGARMKYVVEPVTAKTTLAAQQEGVGVTIHSDTVAISLSKKQVCLLKDTVSTISEQVSLLAIPLSLTGVGSEDSGIGYSRTPNEQEKATPSPNATPTDPPTASEISTASSSILYQGLSSLWLQLLVSRVTLRLYGRDDTRTSPANQDERCGFDRCAPVRVSLDVESVSMQVDVQERCTDIIFKISSMECDFSKLKSESPPTGCGQWIPYLDNSNGKLFSTSSSNLSDEVLQATVPSQQNSDLLVSPSYRVALESAPKFQPSFLYVKGLLPHGGKVMKAVKMEVSVCAFEAVFWLPVFNLVQSVVAASGSRTPQQNPTKVSPLKLSVWPSVELSVEGFRVILPNRDFSNTILVNTEGAKVTSSVDFAGPEIRFVTNLAGYQRLAQLSSERKQPPLPVYQLGAYSVAVWGVAGGAKSIRTFLYMSSADVQVTYTPPLYSTPQLLAHLFGQDPLSNIVAGHNLEVNFSNSFTVFVGQDQLSGVVKVLDANRPRVSSSQDCTPPVPPTPKSYPDHTQIAPTVVDTAVPFKVLITGKAVMACLLVPRKPESSDAPSGPPGTVSPLLVSALYNPLCTLQCEGGVRKGDASLFSIAVGYNRDLVPISYSDLADVQSWPPSLILVFQTSIRVTSSANPPNVLSVSGMWEHAQDSVSGVGGVKRVSGIKRVSSVGKVVTVQVGRPCKLSCDPGVLEGCLKAVVGLVYSKGEEGTSTEVSDTAISADLSGDNGAVEAKEEDKPTDVMSGKSPLSQYVYFDGTEIKFSTAQVTLEFSVPSKLQQCPSRPASSSPGAHHQPPEDFEGPLILSWEKLDFYFTGKEGSAVCSRLQLFSLGEAGRQYIALPATLECVLTRHLPSSSLDMAELKTQFTLGLLDLRASQKEVLLVSRVVQALLDTAMVCADALPKGEVDGRGGRAVGKKPSHGLSDQAFKDDLRVLEFAYVLDESPGSLRLPEVGEILFHNGSPQLVPTMTWQYWEPRTDGSPQLVPTMTWQYWEPRTVTKLRVLPVPFNIIGEEDFPAISSTIKVVCTLEYWDEAVASFAVLSTFSLSESEEAELSLEPSALQRGYRLWRVSLANVEWFSEESGKLETLDQFVGSSGQPCSLSAILSPLSLAASMQVDSQFSPTHLPSLTLSFQCKSLQATLLHNAKVKGGMFGEYRVVPLRGVADTPVQELLKLCISNVEARCRKIHFSTALDLSVDGAYSLDFVDFRDLLWRSAVSPTSVSLSVGAAKTLSSTSHAPPPGTYVHLHVESTVLKLSQGLVHTSFIAYHLWKNMLDEISSIGGVVKKSHPPSAIPGHYIICNNTDEDLMIGQAETGEELSLPSVCCLGYSWVSHTHLPQNLRLCLHEENSLHIQWTVPFSIDSVGVSCVRVPMGVCVAHAYVEVASLGGLQKQVTIYGSWRFFSTLPIPLCVKLTSLLTEEDREGSASPLIPSSASFSSPSPSSLPSSLPSSPSFSSLPSQPTGLGIEKTLVVPAKGCSLSILGPRRELGGVVFRTEGEGPVELVTEWSSVYPLPCEEGWSKPHLLVELSGGFGVEAHFWFNVQPMGKADKPWGHKITFSPLFTVCNLIPLDLVMVVSDNSPARQGVTPSTSKPLLTPEKGQTAPPSTPELLSTPSKGSPNTSEPLLVPEVEPFKIPEDITLLTPEPTLTPDGLLIPGSGHAIIPHSLSVDTWYNLRFKTSTGWAVSEPPVSLSTFLLQNLPVTFDDPSSPDPAITRFSLPLDVDRGRHCKVQAALLRDSLNTITVDLRAEFVVVNATPFTFDLVEPTFKATEEAEESGLKLGPSAATLVCQNEVVLKVEHKGSLFISNLLTLPNISAIVKGKRKSSVSSGDDPLPDVLVALNPVSRALEINSKLEHVTVGKAIVSFQCHHTSLTATIKPAFVFMNSSPFTVHIVTCITEKGAVVSSDRQPSPDHYEMTEGLEPGKCHTLFFWNLLGSSLTSKGAIHSLLLSGCKLSTTDTVPWSIHLSTNFVRHSFSLPVSQPSQSFAACLLTMHEDTGITYLVLQQDPAPRVWIQNLTETHFQVVEPGMVGIHGCLQSIPALHEVAYEPPSLAKLYPMVYDEDIASEHDKRTQEAAKNVKMKLRKVPLAKPGSSDGVSQGSEDWSVPFLVVQGCDRELEVPGFGMVMASTESRVCGGVFISLLPALGVAPYRTLTSQLGVLVGKETAGLPEFELSVAQIVVLLCDDTQRFDHSTEVLRFMVSNLEFSHRSSKEEAAKIGLTLNSLRVDNMMKASSEEFAVAFLPRSEHAAPQQLIKQSPPPLLKFHVEYNPRAKFQIASIYISLQPATFQLEDDLLQRLKSLVVTFVLPEVRVADTSASSSCVSVLVPLTVLQESERDSHPVSVSSLVIEPISVYVSANINLRAYLSCKDTPFRFSRYELVDVFSNWSEVSQIVAARYMSALFMHIGWVLGSLELIGSPVSFIQSVSRGLSDLVRLPYEGLTRSPSLFIMGIGQGTASFVRQFSSGALGSVTNLASSIARNMENLSMDPDHVTYQDRQRRERPTKRFSEGLMSGVSSFGLSLVSAVAGLVEQPVQSFLRKEESAGTTTTLLKGVGKGLLGVVTKPVGGAMDLVSKTGQGIMHGTGLAQQLDHWELPGDLKENVQMEERASLMRSCGGQARHLKRSGPIMALYAAGLICQEQPSQASLLFLTRYHLYIWDRSTDSLIIEFPIRNCSISVSPSSTSGHVHLCIQTHPSSDKEEVSPDSGYEMVRQYLQQSIADTRDRHLIADIHNQQSSIAGVCNEASQGLAADPVGTASLPPAEDVGGGGEGLVVCLGGLWAEQFCAVWESMTQDSVPPT